MPGASSIRFSSGEGQIHFAFAVFANQPLFGVQIYGWTVVGPMGVYVISQLRSREPIAPATPVDCGPIVTIVGIAVGDTVGDTVGDKVGNTVGLVGAAVGDTVGLVGVTVGDTVGLVGAAVEPTPGQVQPVQ